MLVWNFVFARTLLWAIVYVYASAHMYTYAYTCTGTCVRVIVIFEWKKSELRNFNTKKSIKKCEWNFVFVMYWFTAI